MTFGCDSFFKMANSERIKSIEFVDANPCRLFDNFCNCSFRFKRDLLNSLMA
jgi:hypothetical protein